MDLTNYKKIEEMGGIYYINKEGLVWDSRKEKFLKVYKRKATGKEQYYLHYNNKTTTKSIDTMLLKYFPKEIDSLAEEEFTAKEISDLLEEDYPRIKQIINTKIRL